MYIRMSLVGAGIEIRGTLVFPYASHSYNVQCTHVCMDAHTKLTRTHKYTDTHAHARTHLRTLACARALSDTGNVNRAALGTMSWVHVDFCPLFIGLFLEYSPM